MKNRSNPILDEFFPDFLEFLLRHFLKIRDHFQVFPYPGKHEAGSPGHLSFRGQEFFVEKIRNVQDFIPIKGLNEPFFVLFPADIHHRGFAHEINEPDEFILVHPALEGEAD